MKDLEYFVGKVCTVFTVPINRHFKDENPATFTQTILDYFLGIIEGVCLNPKGIIVRRLNSNTKSFINYEYLVSIAEEEFLSPENEKDAVIIEQIKIKDEEIRKTAKNISSASSTGNLVDIQSLLNLANKK